jgi:hypothetical protein
MLWPLRTERTMRFFVTRGRVHLGEFRHENTDGGMGVVTGRLQPSDAYEEMQPFFRWLSGRLHRKQALGDADWRQRNDLDLALVASDGSRIQTAWMMVWDFGDEITLEAQVSDRSALAKHFLAPDCPDRV